MDDFDSVGPAGDEDFTLPRGTMPYLVNRPVRYLPLTWNTLSLATLKKFVQDCLGEIACSKESYDLISNCCVEFIHLLSSEAMEICEKSNKKTMSAEHVFSALKVRNCWLFDQLSYYKRYLTS